MNRPGLNAQPRRWGGPSDESRALARGIVASDYDSLSEAVSRLSPVDRAAVGRLIREAQQVRQDRAEG